MRSATWPLAGRPETVDQASWPTLTGGQDRLDRRPIQALPGDYGCFYRAILAALAGREPNPVPAEAARLVMKLLDTARRSAQEGRRLPFTA
ncbi:MAG TPA: hypothetical protein DCX65_00055 [Spirochaetaceae bacterium]|nr:hypothetical protein [Spirochaetaceae bacterium]